MQRSARDALLLIILASLCLACSLAWAEEGMLVVIVTDTQSHPVPGLRIGVKGNSESPQITDQNGKARMRLAPGTRPSTSVSLQIVKSPSGMDLTMISPDDGRVQVPPFNNESENYVRVVVAGRGEVVK